MSAGAQTAMEEYDSLSRLSSAQLMEDGRVYFENRQPGKALACFTIISERYRDGMNSDEASTCIRALNNAGCVYKFFYFEYAEAYDCFTRALSLCEEKALEEMKPVVLVNLGDLLNDYGIHFVSQSMTQQALEIFDLCIDEAQKTRNWELMVTAFFNLSNQNYSLDLNRYTILFSDEIPAETSDLEYVRLQYRGIEHIQQQRYAEARACFERQLAAVTAQWEPERDTLATLMSIAHTYRLEENYDRAKDYLQRALNMSEDKGVDDQTTVICQLLSEYCQADGDDNQARAYHLKYLETKETMNDSRLANIVELNYVNELKKEQHKARELDAKQQRQQLILLFGSVALVIVLGSAVLLWRKNRELSARNKSLFEKTQQVMKVEAEEQQLRRSNTRQSSERRESLIVRIQEILEDPAMICQQDFTVAYLAKLAESNTTYVSDAIHDKYNQPFSTVLGAYRVREACRRMNDTEHYGNHTIEAISAGVGFKSRTSFFTAFKRETGLTPSEYLRMATQQTAESAPAAQHLA